MLFRSAGAAERHGAESAGALCAPRLFHVKVLVQTSPLLPAEVHGNAEVLTSAHLLQRLKREGSGAWSLWRGAQTVPWSQVPLGRLLRLSPAEGPLLLQAKRQHQHPVRCCEPRSRLDKVLALAAPNSGATEAERARALRLAGALEMRRRHAACLPSPAQKAARTQRYGP